MADWTVVVKNVSGNSNWLNDFGIIVPSGGQVTLSDVASYELIGGSKDLKQKITDDVFIINDGTDDLNKNDSIDYVTLENVDNVLRGEKITLGTSLTYDISGGLWFGNGDTGIYETSDNTISMITSGTEAIRILDNQYVGIGANIPETFLHVHDKNTVGFNGVLVESDNGHSDIKVQSNSVSKVAGLRLFRSTNEIGGLILDRSSSVISGATQDDIVLYTNTGAGTKLHLATEDTSRLIIDSTGNFGIGGVLPDGDTKVLMTTNDTGDVTLAVQELSGQTRNLQEWRDTSGNNYAALKGATFILNAQEDGAIPRFTMEALSNAYTSFNLHSYSETNWHGNFLAFHRGRGTKTSPTSVFNGDYIFQFDLWARDSDNTDSRRAQMYGKVDGAISSGIVPTSWEWVTTDTSGNLYRRVKIGQSGDLTVYRTDGGVNVACQLSPKDIGGEFYLYNSGVLTVNLSSLSGSNSYINSGAYFGIGNNDPQEMLDVTGNILADGIGINTTGTLSYPLAINRTDSTDNAQTIVFQENDFASAWLGWNTLHNRFDLQTSGNNARIQFNSGNGLVVYGTVGVGIGGIVTPVEKLEVEGNIKASGDIIYTGTQSLTGTLGDIEAALDAILGV